MRSKSNMIIKMKVNSYNFEDNLSNIDSVVESVKRMSDYYCNPGVVIKCNSKGSLSSYFYNGKTFDNVNLKSMLINEMNEAVKSCIRVVEVVIEVC